LSSRYCRALRPRACYADNVELSEPPTSEGAITKSPNRIAEVRAVRGTGPPFGQNHHAVRASRHFFRGHRPHVQEGWTVVLEPGNFKRIIARIAPGDWEAIGRAC
jgi:hypothetical protein